MTTTIDVILIKDIHGLGKFGDKKTVRLGFARNFLLPQAKALLVSPANLYLFESLRKKEDKRKAQLFADAEATRKILDGKEVIFKSKAQEKGHLYGSVTLGDVIDYIKKEFNITLQKKYLKMSDHIKDLGEYDINVVLHENVEFQIKLIVEAVEEKESGKKK
ncbi:MAG: 50S ribosomal protein L9 [bacterium]|nr:50S ribosomal protein L9 [bacterium]